MDKFPAGRCCIVLVQGGPLRGSIPRSTTSYFAVVWKTATERQSNDQTKKSIYLQDERRRATNDSDTPQAVERILWCTGELCPGEPNDAYRVVLVKNDDAEAPQCITINGAAVVQNDSNVFLVVMQFHGAGALVELSVNSV